MKKRTALYIFVGSLVALALVFFASNLQAGTGSSIVEMIAAQRHTPLLWVVDACAVAMVGGVWWFAVMLDHFQQFTAHQAQQHHEQLDGMIERTSELDRVSDEYADSVERLETELSRQFHDLTDQISTLEAASDARREVFEVATQRVSEQAYRLFRSQLETNTRQVEAMNMALHLQRDEIRKLRYEIRGLQTEIVPPFSRRVRPAELMDCQEDPLYLAPAPHALEARNGADLETEPRERVDGHSELVEDIDQEAIACADPQPGSESEFTDFVEADAIPVSPGPAWILEYTDRPECNSNWKGHVESLFYEADVLSGLSDEDFTLPVAVPRRSRGTGDARDPAIAEEGYPGGAPHSGDPEEAMLPSTSEATA